MVLALSGLQGKAGLCSLHNDFLGSPSLWFGWSLAGLCAIPDELSPWSHLLCSWPSLGPLPYPGLSGGVDRQACFARAEE